ncbi:PREDICTED: pheophytinase, chloroplastic-like isoform X1 [Camelina sativa]|uniref:Pheophytinase, chloroplastic-like isoform X1 n=1 Tax=Camelina sativa TaxID=90675 RepID=A0ABM0UGV6_CAMSA|nr:PREDICTED: pheophytinase, chloroplastic-like isoform X1 [Camelina sativa]
MRALTWTGLAPRSTVLFRTTTSTVTSRRISLRRDRVCVRAIASSSSAAVSGVEAVELVEIGERSKKWKWKGEYSVNYFVKDSPEEVTPASQTVLLVHGFGASIPHWRRNINALSKNHTVYAIDLLGFGASDKPPGFSYTMESWAELILNFLEEVVQKPTILIGNSVGSLACVIAASETESQQDLVKGLVLLNCAGGMNNKAVFDDWRIKLLMPLLLLIDFLLKQRGIASALFNRVKDKENLKNILTNVYGNKDNVDDTLVEIIAGPANTEGALDAFVSILTGPPGPNPIKLIPEITKPVLVLWGDQDGLTPLDGPVGKYFASLPDELPNFNLYVLQGVGHCPQDDRPDLVHERLLPWLAQLTST